MPLMRRLASGAALGLAATLALTPPAAAGGNGAGILAVIGGLVVGAAISAAQQPPPPAYYPAPAYQPSYAPPAYPPYAPPAGMPHSSGGGPGVQFQQLGWSGGRLNVRLSGIIQPGDGARAQAFAQTILVGTPVRVILDSPGGDIITAGSIAPIMLGAGVATYVSAGTECASACFLLYAAGRERSYGPGALIGVHSAANGAGQETASSEAMTTRMARAYQLLGVPPAIIGRMVATKQPDMAWLTPAELASMWAVQVAAR
jgi:hypothetical protein